MPSETTEQLRKRVELRVAKMDQERNPEEILKDLQRVQCAICGSICWRSYGGTMTTNVDFMATYTWHRAGWCEACSVIVCGICSFVEARRRGSETDLCPRCGAKVL